MFLLQNIGDLFDKIHIYSSNLKHVTLPEIQKFMQEEQNDFLASNKEAIRNFVCDFLKDPQR